MSFWQSNLGEITGKPEDAYTRSNMTIPDNTKALAKIETFKLISNKDKEYYEINWLLTDGDYKGFHVFHKIHAFDSNEKKRHRSLNMLKLIFQLYNIKPKDNAPPADDFLLAFVGKVAGIKIQEWSAPKSDGSGMMEGNFVSEVHAAQNFVSETGHKKEVVHTPNPLETAFSRNPAGAPIVAEDDIPF